MGYVRFSHRLDLNAVRLLLASPQGGVAQDMLRRGLLVETQAKRNISGGGGYPKRVDTGRARASINTQLVVRDGRPIAVVGSNVYYIRWIHDGTGIYGPRGRVIRPVRRRFMRWKPRGGGKWIYARKVRGMRPNPFLRNALVAARY